MSKDRFFWGSLTSADFKDLDPERTIAVVPVAAIEQHGPHLPVSTDTAIAEGMLATLRKMLPDDLNVLVLPVQAYGKSNEHLLSPGTVTLPANVLLDLLIEIGASIARAGLRKVVLMNSHGGNADVLGIVARELRVRHRMLCVVTQWRRFGLPPGMYDAVEERLGVHAGDIETSLMLHFCPDLVRMGEAGNFVSNALVMEQEFKYLRPIGPHAFGWIAQDLNAAGAVGDASMASAEKGEKTAAHQVEGFIDLLRDITAFSLDRLQGPDADSLS